MTTGILRGERRHFRRCSAVETLKTSCLQASLFILLRRGYAGRMSARPRIEIEYCTQCRWLLRAAWMAQELLVTFEREIGEVALVPGTGGVFEIRAGADTIWSRAAEGRFPEIKELKQLVRDCVAPGRDLGHSDRR
jgi:selenoprotein W-related protein